MTEFRFVTPDFAVAAQMRAVDAARAVSEGFKVLICNRPDGEDPSQPAAAQIKHAAEAGGLVYCSLPFAGHPPPGVVAQTAAVLAESKGPVLAYCRTGRRSIIAWALAQALSGDRTPDEIVALAAKAGYDLAGARGALDTLAPKS